MIGTYAIKQQQLRNGYFQTGTGPLKILIMGSCRVAPLVDYYDQWNSQNNNQLTIYSIDPFNWNWNEKDERVDYLAALKTMETHEELLNMLKSVDVFCHEYYSNSGMFNVAKLADGNIYDFGLSPKHDICLPNWNDKFILVNDIVTFDTEIRKKVMQDMNVLGKISDQLQHEIFELSVANLHKFFEICLLSDIPEMQHHFQGNMRGIRFFHSYNHVSKFFTLFLFEMINKKWLHLNITPEFMHRIAQEDMFANSFTKITEYDIKLWGLNWGEEIHPLAI